MSVLRGYQIMDKLRRKIKDPDYAVYDELNEAQRWIASQTNFTWLRKRSEVAVAAIAGTNTYSLNLANVKSFSAIWIAPSATESSVDISDITLSGTDAVVITTSSVHGLSTGDQGTFSGVGGTTELNGNTYTFTVVDTTNFSLDGTNSSAFSAFTSGGYMSQWATTTTQWKFMEEAPAKVFEDKVQYNENANVTNITDTYLSNKWYYYLEVSATAPFYTIRITPTPDDSMMVRVDYTKRLTDIDPDTFADIPPGYYDSLINLAAGYILERSEKESDMILAQRYMARGRGDQFALLSDSQPNRTENIDRPNQPWIE